MIYFIYCIGKMEFAWTFILVIMMLIYNQLNTSMLIEIVKSICTIVFLRGGRKF